MTQSITQVSILGTGKMGTAVGRKLAQAGVRVVYGSRNPSENADKFADLANVSVVDYARACADSDCVIVAVPWVHTLDLMHQHHQALSDKVVVDMTNPTNADWSYLVTSGDKSAAEEITDASTSARVVKAFNGILADNFAQPNFSGEPAQAFYCGNDDEAKSAVRELIDLCGYAPIDCGSLEIARYLEPLAMWWVQMAFWEEWGNEFRIKLVGTAPELGSVMLRQTN